MYFMAWTPEVSRHRPPATALDVEHLACRAMRGALCPGARRRMCVPHAPRGQAVRHADRLRETCATGDAQKEIARTARPSPSSGRQETPAEKRSLDGART